MNNTVCILKSIMSHRDIGALLWGADMQRGTGMYMCTQVNTHMHVHGDGPCYHLREKKAKSVLVPSLALCRGLLNWEAQA